MALFDFRALSKIPAGGDFLFRERDAEVHPLLWLRDVWAGVVVFDDDGAIGRDAQFGGGEPFLREPLVGVVKVGIGAAVAQYGVAAAGDFARL